MLLTSLTSSPSLKVPPPGYSLRWYAALLDAEQMRHAAWNSLLVAAWATAVSVVFGTAGALAIAGNRTRWARACDVVFMSPLLLPALAFGFAALVYVHLIGFRPSLFFLVLGHA
ncbi:MAG TPA: ABC transporter permease, partial [Candidatus Dormibacteraeota bacterium]|nr:ABC transporter permease [Candidatus Dormibacteraeota bacterium]